MLKHGSVVGVGVWLGRGVIVAVGVADRVGVSVGAGLEVKVPVGVDERPGVFVNSFEVCVGRSPDQEVQAPRLSTSPRARKVKFVIALQPGCLPPGTWRMHTNFKMVAEDLITCLYCNQ